MCGANGWQETQSYFNDHANIQIDDCQLLGRIEAGSLTDEAKTGIIDQNLRRRLGGFDRRGDSGYRALFDQIEHQHQGPWPARRRDFIGERFERGAAAIDKSEIVTMSCEDAGETGADPAGGAGNHGDAARLAAVLR